MYCLDNIDNIKNTVRPKKTAHVYVPYNCGRKCPFCESRKMYDTLDVSLDKTLEVLRRIADSDIEDIMITGGEPCDNLDYLGKMLDILKDKIVYVNTLFPSESAKDITHMFDVEYPCVKGINVSRHLSTYEKDSAFLYAPATDDVLGNLKVPVRINCVIQDRRAPFSWVDSVVRRWEKQHDHKPNLELHFRENFNEVTAENLHIQDSPFLKTLCENYKYHYYNMGTSFDDVSFLSDSGMTGEQASALLAEYRRRNKIGTSNTYTYRGSTSSGTKKTKKQKRYPAPKSTRLASPGRNLDAMM